MGFATAPYAPMSGVQQGFSQIQASQIDGQFLDHMSPAML